MDAQDWHRQATTPAPAWPDPVSITDFDALSRECRDDYFRRLRGAMNATIVVSKPMEAVAAHLDDIVATNRLRPPGAMPMIAVTAPFSAGKSTLLKHWGYDVYRGVLGGQAKEERPTWSPQRGVMADWVPVVYVTLMASSSIKEINALILLYLGYPPEGLARTTTTRVLHALRMHGVQVVILDDAHMLRTTSAQGRAVLDNIKFLNTELGEVNRGTVILVGAHLESTAILDDPQIRARLTTMTIDAFQITTIEKKAAWQDLLATVGDRPHYSIYPTQRPTCSSPSWPSTSGGGRKASSARWPNSSLAPSSTLSTTGAASSRTTTSTRSNSANVRLTAKRKRPPKPRRASGDDVTPARSASPSTRGAAHVLCGPAGRCQRCDPPSHPARSPARRRRPTGRAQRGRESGRAERGRRSTADDGP